MDAAGGSRNRGLGGFPERRFYGDITFSRNRFNLHQAHNHQRHGNRNQGPDREKRYGEGQCHSALEGALWAVVLRSRRAVGKGPLRVAHGVFGLRQGVTVSVFSTARVGASAAPRRERPAGTIGESHYAEAEHTVQQFFRKAAAMAAGARSRGAGCLRFGSGNSG